MKKLITFLGIISRLIFLSFFVKPQLVHADEKTYTIATDVTVTPYEYANDSSKYVDIDIDVMNAIAKEEGFKVDLKPIGFNDALQSVSAEQGDGMIAGMTITDERKQKFDFSKPYY